MRKIFKRLTALALGATVFATSLFAEADYVGTGYAGANYAGTIVAEAATSTAPDEIKEAIRQLCLHMYKNHEYGYHYVRNWNIKFQDYYEIWHAAEEEVEYERNLNVNTVVQSVRDSDGYIEYIYVYSEDQFMQERAAAVEAAKAYCHEQLKGMGDLDKLIWLNEYIVDNTYYYNDPDDVTRHHYTSVFGYGHGVCSAYAEAMECLLVQENIPVEEVFSSNHEWLGVTIDGKEYHYDPTWDDTRGVRHRYLLRNDDEWGKSPCTHQTWFRYKNDGLGTKITTPVSTSTDFVDWYVHDVSGRMLYHDGKWYYANGKSIYKNDAYGNCEEEVYTGTSNVTLVGITNDVLSYTQSGQVKTIILKETAANGNVAACSHSNTELRGVKEANCKFAGYTGDKYCTDCGIKMSNGQQVKISEHQYGEAVPVKLSTKNDYGYDLSTCSVCGYVKKTNKAKLKDADAADGACIHANTEYVGKVIPTCVKDGFTGKTVCSDCGAVIYAGEEVKCTGHIWKKQDGSTTVEKCMLCDATKGEETTTEKQTTTQQTTSQKQTTTQQTTSQKQTTAQQTTSQKQTTAQQTTSQKQTTAQQTTTKSTSQTTTQRETVQPQTTTKSTSQTTTSEKETTKSTGQTTTSEKETTKSAGQTTTAEKQTTSKGETTAQQTTTKSTSQTTSQRETTSEKATTDKQTTTSEKATTDKQTTTSEKATTDKQTTTSGKTPEKETTKSEEITTKPNGEEKVSKIKSFVVNKTNKNSVKLKWKKNTKVKGYEVSIYKNKKWTKLKNVSAKTTTLNVKKLKSGTYYRFRIRGYVRAGNNTTYGAYTYCSTMTVPDKMSTPKVSKSGKKTVIKWKKENCSGYQIVYSKTKSFKKAGRVNVYGNKKTSYKTGKLKKKTTYYVKIRAFTKVKGKKVYGKYSGVRKVTKFST